MAESGSPTSSDISTDEASESELLDRSLSVWKGWSPVEKEDFAPIPLDTHTASSIGQYECIKNIIVMGVSDLDRKNLGGWTPLMYACYIGHDNIVKLLLDADVDVNLKNHKAQTPLMLAASCGNESVGYYLCQRAVELESRDSRGWTALFHATYAGHQNMVRFLLEQGSNINAIEPTVGMTPFMEAAIEGHEIIVHLFLQHGVNVNAKTYNGDTARSLALSNGHTKIVSLIDNYVMPITCLKAEPGFEADLSSSDDSSQKTAFPLGARGPRGKGKGPSICDGPEAIAKLIDRTPGQQAADINYVPQGYVTFPQSEIPNTTQLSYRDVTSPINPQDYNLDSSGDKDSMDNDNERSAFSQTGAITIKSSSSSSGGLVAALGMSREGSVDSDEDHHSKAEGGFDKKQSEITNTDEGESLATDSALLELETLVRTEDTTNVWNSNSTQIPSHEIQSVESQEFCKTNENDKWTNMKPGKFPPPPINTPPSMNRFNECWKKNQPSPDNTAEVYKTVSGWEMNDMTSVDEKQICDLVSRVALGSLPSWDNLEHEKLSNYDHIKPELVHGQGDKIATYSGEFDNVFNRDTVSMTNKPEFCLRSPRSTMSSIEDMSNTPLEACAKNMNNEGSELRTVDVISKTLAQNDEKKIKNSDCTQQSITGTPSNNDVSEHYVNVSDFVTSQSQALATSVPTNNNTPIAEYARHEELAYAKLTPFHQDHGRATTKKDDATGSEPVDPSCMPPKDFNLQHAQGYQVEIATDFPKLYSNFPSNPANNHERRDAFPQRDIFRAQRPSRSDRPQDLPTLLDQLGMSKYICVFDEQDVDLHVFLSLTDNDLKEIGIKLFGPRKKMTNAIARWHSNAKLLSDDLEQAYADRLENEMQEMALQLTQAYEEAEKLQSQVGKEQQLRSVTESFLMEERAAWQLVHRTIMETRQHCEDMREMLVQQKNYQLEMKQRLYNDRKCGTVPVYKRDPSLAMQDDMILDDKLHDKDLATETLIRKSELYTSELQQLLAHISMSMDRLLGRKAIQP